MNKNLPVVAPIADFIVCLSVRMQLINETAMLARRRTHNINNWLRSRHIICAA